MNQGWGVGLGSAGRSTSNASRRKFIQIATFSGEQDFMLSPACYGRWTLHIFLRVSELVTKQM